MRWSCCCCLVLLACGTKERTSIDGGPVTISAESFSAAFAEAYCDRVQQCCQTAGGSESGDCVSARTLELEDRKRMAEQAEANFDPRAAADCLSATELLGCDPDMVSLRDLNRLCNNAWRGTRPNGEPCTSALECQQPEHSSAKCDDGMCGFTIHLPPGQDCGPGLPCDPLSATCEGGRCVALPAAGQPCEGTCRAELGCEDGICAMPLRVGDVCSSDEQCAAGRCTADQCAPALVADETWCTLP